VKLVLVEGVWDRVRSRLVPLEVGGTVPMRDFLEQPQVCENLLFFKQFF
jgi:hypothetical protein